MRAVDRGLYCGGGERAAARPAAACYLDTPLPLGWGATISAPHMHAYALELLRGWLRPGARVLDVGSGERRGGGGAAAAGDCGAGRHMHLLAPHAV